MLSREQILQADDLRREKVLVPEWGDHVYVRTMSGAERDEHDQIAYKRNQAPGAAGAAGNAIRNIRATQLAFTLCDEAGNRLFTIDDIEALGDKSGAALDRLFDVSRRLNKVTDADIKELAGN